MILSSRLFRLCLILAGLWIAYIVGRALFVIWRITGEAGVALVGDWVADMWGSLLARLP